MFCFRVGGGGTMVGHLLGLITSIQPSWLRNILGLNSETSTVCKAAGMFALPVLSDFISVVTDS